MIGKRQEINKVANIVEVVDILEERKKKGELLYEQNLAYEHAKKFAGMSVQKAEAISKELRGFNISEKAIAKIIEIMPIDETQLKQVLIIEKKQIDEDVVKGILSVIEKYRSG